MTYMSHTASRIREEAYGRHYLGRAAVEKKRKFLTAEKTRIESELAAAEREERIATEYENYSSRLLRFLPELKLLFPSIENTASYNNDLEKARTELAAIDTQSFRELEDKRNEIENELSLIKINYDQRINTKGGYEKEQSIYKNNLESLSFEQKEKDDAIKSFSGNNPAMIGDYETYAQEKLSKSSLEELKSTYESTLKKFKTRTDSLRKEYAELVRGYEQEFNNFQNLEPSDNIEAETLLKRLETSKLPEYREKSKSVSGRGKRI